MACLCPRITMYWDLRGLDVSLIYLETRDRLRAIEPSSQMANEKILWHISGGHWCIVENDSNFGRFRGFKYGSLELKLERLRRLSALTEMVLWLWCLGEVWSLTLWLHVWWHLLPWEVNTSKQSSLFHYIICSYFKAFQHPTTERIWRSGSFNWVSFTLEITPVVVERWTPTVTLLTLCICITTRNMSKSCPRICQNPDRTAYQDHPSWHYVIQAQTMSMIDIKWI